MDRRHAPARCRGPVGRGGGARPGAGLRGEPGREPGGAVVRGGLPGARRPARGGGTGLCQRAGSSSTPGSRRTSRSRRSLDADDVVPLLTDDGFVAAGA
ncbi:hypothetical protein [Nocardioides convexus]|uniref:hypothetical protein n=1 Tax=Nocardioides convexus TaxID=2712224 RepID=UPI0024189185|nr:hypothetical protein [Nocardioides convexus]